MFITKVIFRHQGMERTEVHFNELYCICFVEPHHLEISEYAHGDYFIKVIGYLRGYGDPIPVVKYWNNDEWYFVSGANRVNLEKRGIVFHNEEGD